MTSLSKYIAVLLLIGAALVGCEGEYDSVVDANLDRNPIPDMEIQASQGDADFSNYVAIGNSLTAGFMDGALYNNGQSFSLGAQLSGQFEFTGAPATFNQPDINSVNGFNTSVNSGNGPVLGRFKLDTSIPGPSPVLNGDPIGPYTGSASALNNFGVPGIQVGQLLTPDTGNPSSPLFNPFYARFASTPGLSTIMDDVISAEPTFFTLWIGNNDVLGYATSGASNETILTDDTDFQNQFGAVVGQLMNNTTADGVIADIPFFLGLAYFQAVRWDNITLDEATASNLNQNLQPVNGAIQACANPFDFIDSADAEQRLISYTEGNNPILVIDEELTDLGTCFDTLQGASQINAQQRAALVPYEQSRPLTQGELVVLGAGSVLGNEADGDASVADTPIGVVIPLGFNMTNGELSGDQNYLTLAEQQLIETKRLTFNGIIAATVNAYSDRIAYYATSPFVDQSNPCTDGVFCDVFGLSDGVVGITVDGVNLAADFSPNGILSTDGVHPNPRGNAIIANEFIRVIEDGFNATIPKVDVNALPSVSVCAGDCVSQQGGS